MSRRSSSSSADRGCTDRGLVRNAPFSAHSSYSPPGSESHTMPLPTPIVPSSPSSTTVRMATLKTAVSLGPASSRPTGRCGGGRRSSSSPPGSSGQTPGPPAGSDLPPASAGPSRGGQCRDGRGSGGRARRGQRRRNAVDESLLFGHQHYEIRTASLPAARNCFQDFPEA